MWAIYHQYKWAVILLLVEMRRKFAHNVVSFLSIHVAKARTLTVMCLFLVVNCLHSGLLLASIPRRRGLIKR